MSELTEVIVKKRGRPRKAAVKESMKKLEHMTQEELQAFILSEEKRAAKLAAFSAENPDMGKGWGMAVECILREVKKALELLNKVSMH
jgi:hypothetical protein